MAAPVTSQDLVARREAVLAEASRLLTRRAELQAATEKAGARVVRAIGDADDKGREKADAEHAKAAGELASVNLNLGRLRQAVIDLDLAIPERKRAEAEAARPALKQAVREQEAIVLEAERKLLALRNELGNRARAAHAAGTKASAPPPRLGVRRTVTHTPSVGEPVTYTMTDTMPVTAAWAAVATGAVTFEDPIRQALATLGGGHA